ncbi:DUF89 domain-containing protein [Microthyrium microscopicum]|uniref:Sugar phosphate phosphatase n=1 Tax=Microthyrium microscopicum TaxID=703497 RepID=A0A6A6U4E5_9PEZI|nr:DUF89 domain-containing protein [Microthyrium microscopicum]
MEFDTKTPQYKNDDRRSFAWPSARERWPVILTQAIDDVHRAVADSSDADARTEGKAIIADLAKLKYELQHDRTIMPLPDDGLPDIAGYNKEIEQRNNPSWFSCTWLFSECYMYRRAQTYFNLSKHWKSYDIFSRSKISGFKSSRPAVIELASQYKDIITELETSHQLKGAKTEDEIAKAEELVFMEMCKICLWGNKTDLSLLTNITSDDFSRLQGAKAREASEDKILVNDLADAFQVLYKAQKSGASERRVDFVLDNAGFELFVDLVLAGYLLAAGLATTVVLHPKTMPWFVSDVVPQDFIGLLNALRDSNNFFGASAEGQPAKDLSADENGLIGFLFQNWSNLHAEGKLILRPNHFWTEGGSFWRLPATAPELFEDLKESELVIFKGDLNYRKLTADAMWEGSTPFAEAIGPLGPGSGIRVLALRTCKGDVVAGLPKGKDEELRKTGDDPEIRKWAWSGEWAVCQFFDGKQ